MRFTFFVLVVLMILFVCACLCSLTGCASAAPSAAVAAVPAGSGKEMVVEATVREGFLGTGKTLGQHLLSLVRLEGCLQKRRICLAGTVAGAGPELCLGFKLPGDECYGGTAEPDDAIYYWDVPPIDPAEP